MSTEESGLHYIARQPAAPKSGQPLLVLLHGYGSNEEDLMGLAAYLDPRFALVSVRAPLRLDMGGFAWFKLEQGPQGLRFDPAEALAARDMILALLEDLARQWQVEAADIYLLGFSQGAGMALSAALAHARALGGVAFLSGLYRREMLPTQDLERLRGLAVMMTQGRWDPLIPVEAGRQTHQMLKSLPLELSYAEYDMGHEINGPCLEDLKTWLGQRLDGPKPK